MDTMDAEPIISTSILLASLASLLVGLLIYQQIRCFSFWSSRGIPGPTPVPFLGTNFYYFFKAKAIQDKEWHDKYGKTYGLYEGLQPSLRTIDNSIIKHTFVKNFQDFADRNSKYIFSDAMRGWLLFSPSAHWTSQRALITPMFTSLRMRLMIQPTFTCIERFMKMVDSKLAVKSNGTHKAVEPPIHSKDDFLSLTMDFISSTFLGLKIDTYRDKSSDFFRKAFAFANFDLKHFFVWLFVPSFIAKLIKMDPVPKSSYEYIDMIGQSIIDNRRKEDKKDVKRNDMVQAFLEASLPDRDQSVHNEADNLDSHYNDMIDHSELNRIHKEQVGQVKFTKFSDREIVSQLTFFIIAGFETTSASISFCFYELSHQPEVQAELLNELKNAIANDGDTLNDYTKLASLKKLDAFVGEVLRLYSPVIEHHRLVTKKGGVLLPLGEGKPSIHLAEGVIISVTPHAAHWLAEYWTEPMKFDMSRFYPENKDKVKSCTYMPFGLGPRNCAGMRFALMNIKLTVATLLLKYKVTQAPGSKYPATFRQHSFFLQLDNTDFCLSPRE